MKYLIFDTETTDLIRRDEKTNKKQYPYIVQISWILYDGDSRMIEKEEDYILRLPEYVLIPESSTKIHGITNRTMRAEGKNPITILKKFHNDLSNADMLVAHNINFDTSVLWEELKRNQMFYALTQLKNTPRYCTMYMSKNICKIEKKDKETGEIYYKSPKLIELHQHLFNTTPNNLHNSLVDIWVCWRCFCQIHLNYDLIECKDNWHYYDELRLYYKFICKL